MSQPDITVYGAYWCPDCHRSKQFLGEHQIPYNWVDIEEKSEGEQFVIKANEGKRRIPTLAFSDGSILTNPSNADLAQKLGLKTTAERHHYDLIVIGGGPAGMTAGLYTAREGIDTLLIERAALGGQAAATMTLDNVPASRRASTATTTPDVCGRRSSVSASSSFRRRTSIPSTATTTTTAWTRLTVVNTAPLPFCSPRGVVIAAWVFRERTSTSAAGFTSAPPATGRSTKASRSPSSGVAIAPRRRACS